MGDPKPKRKPLSRRGTDRRNDRPWVEARAAWRARAVMYGCNVCQYRGQECEGQLAGHHWLYEQFIRRYVSAYAHEHALAFKDEDQMMLELIWAQANGGGLCERAHRRHHNRTEPITLDLVPLRAITFAASLGLGHRLEASYPTAAVGSP